MLANSACASQRPERLLADDVWMFVYKVVMCPLKHSHDWEKCIYAHDGERARRRHPSMYQAIQCPEARAKKVCPRGEECPCTHHLFEYWLHPDRYMTCLCELGAECNRPICFFAHHEAELRPLPEGLSVAPNALSSSKRRAAAASAATAAAVQSGRMPASRPGVGGQPSDMGLRQLSASSLASSGGSQGTSLADSASAGAYPGSSGASSSVSVLLQQQQAMANALAAESSNIRPGFSALGSIKSPANQSGGAFGGSYAASSALKAASAQQQQQQMASRAAAAGSHACPVLVLEAPPPMTMAPQDSAQLQQAAQQFSQLKLTTPRSTWWLSPSASRAAQSNSNMSNMSLNSSTSSPVDMQGPAGADGVTFLASAGNSSTALMIDPLLLNRARFVSPLSSPLACSSPGASMLGLDGGAGLERSAGQQQLQAAGLNVSRLIMAGVHQGAMDDSPEHLSFSLWDMNAPGALSGPPRPMLTQHLAQVPISSSTAAVRMGGLEGFGGFAAGRSSSGGGSGRGAAAAAVPAVSSLASAAADRLLLAQQVGRLSAGGMGGVPRPVLSAADQAGAGVDADTAREARLTLLRAWVNASTAAARGALRSADGSLEQQEERLLQASVEGGMGRVARLGNNGVAAVAHDLASVLTPADVMLLVQQLHGMLSN